MAGAVPIISAGNAAVINIVANLQPLAKGLAASRGMVGRWANRLKTSMTPLMKFGIIAGIVAGIATITGAVILFAKAAVNAFEEAEVAFAKFNAELRGGGNTAALTGKQYKEMARALEDTTSISEIAGIKMSTALLKANLNAEMFNRSLQLSADLAIAWGISGEDAANRLGIALTNVDVGIRKLRNKFVFTPEEDRNIRNASTQLEKQRMLVEALEKRYGFLAEAYANTFAGQKARLANEFMRLLRETGEELVPVMKALVVSLRAFIPILTSMIKGFVGLISPMTNVLSLFMSWFNILNKFGVGSPAFVVFLDALIERFNILERDMMRFLNAMIAIGVLSKALEDPFNFNLDKTLRDIELIQILFKNMLEAQNKGLEAQDVFGQPPDFGEVGDVGKDLKGKFESLEQTWKRISEAINEPVKPEEKLADSVDKNSEATDKNTTALDHMFDLIDKNALAQRERGFKPEDQPSVVGSVAGQMAEVVAGSLFGPGAAAAVQHIR